MKPRSPRTILNILVKRTAVVIEQAALELTGLCPALRVDGRDLSPTRVSVQDAGKGAVHVTYHFAGSLAMQMTLSTTGVPSRQAKGGTDLAVGQRGRQRPRRRVFYASKDRVGLSCRSSSTAIPAGDPGRP